MRTLNIKPLCPLCRRFLTREDYMSLPRETRIENMDQYKPSSKILRICEVIKEIMARGEKLVIFTQFLGMMDLMEIEFRRQSFVYAVTTPPRSRLA